MMNFHVLSHSCGPTHPSLKLSVLNHFSRQDSGAASPLSWRLWYHVSHGLARLQCDSYPLWESIANIIAKFSRLLRRGQPHLQVGTGRSSWTPKITPHSLHRFLMSGFGCVTNASPAFLHDMTCKTASTALEKQYTICPPGC